VKIRRGQAPSPEPLEPAPEAMAAIRMAEEAAAVRLAAEASDQAAQASARQHAAALLADAAERTARLADERRHAIRASADSAAREADAAAAADISRLERAAADRHDLAIQQAIRFVLTGEAPCTSR
jgi:hypothetical protein